MKNKLSMSDEQHGFPATKIDWDKKEEPTMKAVAWMVEDFKGTIALFPNEFDANDFANKMMRNGRWECMNAHCSVVPLYRSLPTAMKFLPPAPAPSCGPSESFFALCDDIRRESDVGEGWFYLKEDDILQDGDECEISLGTWMPTSCIGDRVGKFSESYRRRVTPVPPAPQSRPAEIREPDVGDGWRMLKPGEITQRGDEQLTKVVWSEVKPDILVDERWGSFPLYYRRRVTPAPEAEGPQDFLPSERWGDGREITLLRAEASLREQVDSLKAEIATLTAEVERLRLTEEEREAISRIAFLLEQHRWRDAPTIKGIADRLGGGE